MTKHDTMTISNVKIQKFLVCDYNFQNVFCNIVQNVFISSLFMTSLDATNTDGFGKMVNDAPYKLANSVMKRILHNGDVYLCLFAKECIEKGTEIR